MVAKTVLGLVVGGVIVEIQAITWFDVIDACIVYIDKYDVIHDRILYWHINKGI